MSYAVDRYLGNTPPRELVVELKEKFGVVLTAAQIRQKLTRSGVGRKKKEIDQRACSLVSSARVAALAKLHAASPSAQLSKWAERAVAGADRAFAMVEAATKPRDLASAAAAAKSLVSTFRLTSGIENSTTRPPGTPTFNFNFSNELLPTRVSVAPEGSAVIELAPDAPKAPPPPV